MIGFASEDLALDAADRRRREVRGRGSVIGWAAVPAPEGGYFARIGFRAGRSVEVWPSAPRTADMAAIVDAEIAGLAG